MKEYDHGMDATRYMVAFKDLQTRSGTPASADDLSRYALGTYADADPFADQWQGEYT